MPAFCHRPAGLHDIEVIARDMSIRKSESIQIIVLQTLKQKRCPKVSFFYFFFTF